MPDPKKYDNQKDWLAACIPTRIREGDKRDQAVAVCMSMWRERSKARGEGQGVGGERQGDGGAETCVCPKCGKEIEHERGEPCTKRKCPDCGATMVGKEIKMDKKAAWTTAYINDLPDSSFLYVESGDKEDGKTVPRSKRHLPYKDASGKVDLPHLRNALSRLGQAGTGKGWLSEDLRTRLLARARKILASQQKSLTARAADWLKQAWGLTEDLIELEPEETKEAPHPFIIYKDIETKEYRWLSVYSNKWRDEDNPPEILASAAHREFVEAVDKGDWPHPELWLWHIPGSRFGVADLVAYDETGFALASGTVDRGMEHIAESLSKEDDLATSHGMPVREIERDTEDSTIITRYRTIEISPLPREAAANKYGTGYELLTEVKMAIPANKRPFLEKHMGANGLEDLERKLAGKAKELEELGIEFKEEALEEEVEQEPEVEPEVDDVEAEEVESEDKKAAPEETPNYVTAEQVVEAVGAILKPLFEEQRALVLFAESLGETVSEQAEEIKALKKEQEAQLKETIANTPAASLFEQIRSAVGAEETLVDGRVSLAKQGPKETLDDRDGPTSVGLINQLMAQSWGQQ